MDICWAVPRSRFFYLWSWITLLSTSIWVESIVGWSRFEQTLLHLRINESTLGTDLYFINSFAAWCIGLPALITLFVFFFYNLVGGIRFLDAIFRAFTALLGKTPQTLMLALTIGYVSWKLSI